MGNNVTSNVGSGLSAPLVNNLPGIAIDGVSGNPKPIPRVQSTSLIGGHVSQSLKDKIWRNEYVDMSLLFADSASEVLARSNKAEEVALVIENDKMFLRSNQVKTSRQKKMDTWDKWVSAFHTFMAIYLVKFPSRVNELLKYTEIVRTASVQFPGRSWRLYDEQFRLRLEAQPHKSWGELDVELWLTVASYEAAPAAFGGAPRAAPHTVTRLCFAFNSPNGCKFVNCKYQHKCAACGRHGHGSPTCRFPGVHTRLQTGGARGFSGKGYAHSVQQTALAGSQVDSAGTKKNAHALVTGKANFRAPNPN
ncbi:uncharacterized protein LOC119741700 [Patiria miniata]|uniref:C3H1-type domain-containing protein n=1 Tax=Patiria miniata TaxID=46514 RepID=A0A914BDH8_PATMI|nr:uncharacterized protein LOC119741700 [Patiria miniata]